MCDLKSKAEYDKAYDAKRKRGFIDTWLTDFPWLEKLQTADDLCICKLCKQFPILADQSSGLFIGQPIFRRDTLVAHEKSSCHARCKIKCDDELRKQKKQIKVGDLDNKFLGWSKLKAFADEKFNITQTLKSVLGRVENSVENGENAGYHHFLLFPQCFLKAIISGS